MNKKMIYADDLLLAIRDDYRIDGRNFSIMREHINDAEAADTVEVVHAQWALADDDKLICDHCKSVKIAYEQLCFFGLPVVGTTVPIVALVWTEVIK